LSSEIYVVYGSALTQLLAESQLILELIKRSDQDLSAVASGIEHALAKGDPERAMHTALQESAAIRKLLREASSALTQVSQRLQAEIRDRNLLDHQLAAAVEQEEGARNAALHDNLTGLPNRELFRDRLEHGIAQAKRHHWMLAVMFVDLDDFKSVNDTHGHQAGDGVLQTVATRLAHSARTDDSVSRYGGDEFLHLVTSLHEQKDIAMIAAKILAGTQAPIELPVEGALIHVRLKASIGISVFPQDGDTADILIKRADEAMYSAKENKSGFAFAQ
jgi:diguanylate cyclase (GGDEF)-like protein